MCVCRSASGCEALSDGVVAPERGVAPAQLAIAWVLAKGRDIVPIPDTKRRKYLEENVASADLRLDAAQLKALDDCLAPGKVSGKRYNEKMITTIDR